MKENKMHQPQHVDELACVCDQYECVCNVGQALLGPANVAADGTIALFWNYPKPSARLHEVVAEFGTPSILDTSPGGMGIWKQSLLQNTPYTEIVIRDEQIKHCCPMVHDDYLYATVCVDLSPDVQLAMIPVTKSVWYDRLTHRLTARCHFMGPNVATLLLVTQMQLGQVPLIDAPALYGGMIMNSSDPMMYDAMTAQLGANLAALGGCPSQNVDCGTITCPKSKEKVTSY